MPGKQMRTRPKYGYELLIERVRLGASGCLFHLTDEAHLASIEQHGLLSRRSRNALRIEPAFPTFRGGSGEENLDDCVYLSFFNLGVMPNHPDAHLRRPVLLKVDPNVLLMSGVQVALGRASRRSTDIYPVGRAFYEMDWPVIRGEVDENDYRERWRFFQVRDYEILVPGRVPIEYIIGIA
jgi:hypothetical protein